jgi:hypothetical protein
MPLLLESKGPPEELMFREGRLANATRHLSILAIGIEGRAPQSSECVQCRVARVFFVNVI